jgi:hypothetical protein
MSSRSPLGRDRGEALHLSSEGDEIASRIWVVIPISPIRSPPSVITAAGAMRPLRAEASAVGVAPLPLCL